MEDKNIKKGLELAISDDDPTASSRKKDHIEMAFKSQIESGQLDKRFYYEPLLSKHLSIDEIPSCQFAGKQMKAPLWVSSMTGGTELAKNINTNLAKVCAAYGLGMGLGSCRKILTEDTYFEDFNMRPILGDAVPFFANLGIAQIEYLIKENKVHLIKNMLDKLSADGLFVHVNPFQELLQPEGDLLEESPLTSINRLLEQLDTKIIVKEVGQGMGPTSLKALMKLPIEGIEFAAAGGTNFSKLELFRGEIEKQTIFEGLTRIGHTAEEMVFFVNNIIEELGDEIQCKQFIISGGVKNFLDGYYFINKLNANCIFGQASGFLKYAIEGMEPLQAYTEAQLKGLAIATAYLKVK